MSFTDAVWICWQRARAWFAGSAAGASGSAMGHTGMPTTRTTRTDWRARIELRVPLANANTNTYTI